MKATPQFERPYMLLVEVYPYRFGSILSFSQLVPATFSFDAERLWVKGSEGSCTKDDTLDHRDANPF